MRIKLPVSGLDCKAERRTSNTSCGVCTSVRQSVEVWAFHNMSCVCPLCEVKPAITLSRTKEFYH